MLTKRRAQPPTDGDAKSLARWLIEWFISLNAPGALNITQTRVTDCDHINLRDVPFTPTVTAGAVTIDLTNGPLQKCVTAANITITLPAAVAGNRYTVIVQYGGVHTVTWAGGGTLKWPAATAPVATSVNGKYDIYDFVCHDSTNTFGSDGGRNF